jgi:hypothetical protein
VLLRLDLPQIPPLPQSHPALTIQVTHRFPGRGRLLESSGAMDATTVGKPPIPTEAVEHGSTQQGTHTAGTDNGGVLPNPGTLVNRSGVSTMNITPQQKDLLIAIVKADQSGDGSPFIFVQHRSGRGLCYEDGRTVPVAADESDFVQLQRENLLTWVRVQGGLSRKANTTRNRDGCLT